MNYKAKRIEKTWYDLTPSEREEYVNQDCVCRSEELLATIENRPFEYVWGTSKPEKKLVYELYFLDRMQVSEIIYHVSYGRSYVYEIVEKILAGIDNKNFTTLQKNILKSHFKDRYSYDEIAAINNCEYDYVSRTVLRYLYRTL